MSLGTKTRLTALVSTAAAALVILMPTGAEAAARGPYSYTIESGVRDDNWASTPKVTPHKDVQVCIPEFASSGNIADPEWFFSIRQASNASRVWASQNYTGVDGFGSDHCSPWINVNSSVYARVTVHPTGFSWGQKEYFKVWLYYN
ncbi:hypothetical protein AAW14_23930 [Streptomyces hygroscopicus]|nr:hypothetical protein [Streptomyces hygroscopicus]